MSLVFPPQQPTYSQLVSELKNKNKQIRFLQDKIVLMQKERQTKIADLSSKYSHALSQHNITSSLVEETNAQLKAKLSKAKQRIKQLQQTHNEQSHQVKYLTELTSTYTKQIKSLKSKYQRQRHHTALLQQQSLNMKSIINVMEKQLRQLSKKNLELIEQKNTLMTTYNDYDEVKWKLGQIHGVYEQQYQEEVRLVKERLRREMVDGFDDRDQGIGRRDETDNKVRMVEKNQLAETRADVEIAKEKTCQKCLLEASWSEDLIKLSNIIAYGAEYILSLSTKQKKSLPPEPRDCQQQKNENYALEDKQDQQDKIQFNYPKTKQIFTFLSQVLKSNLSLQEQLKDQTHKTQTTKSQLQTKITELFEQITTLQEEQQKTTKQSKQSLQQLQQNLNQINKNNLTSSESLTKITADNYHLKQQVQSSQLVINSLLNVAAKLINKCEEIKAKANLSEKANNIRYNKLNFRNKLKQAMLSVFFIQVLKKSSDKLRRKTKLLCGIKPFNVKKSHLQSQSTSNLFENQSISSLIFGPQNQSKSLYFSNQSPQLNLLKRCIYQIKREQIINGKRKHQNLNLFQELIKKLPQSQDHQVWPVMYKNIIQIVYQHSFQSQY